MTRRAIASTVAAVAVVAVGLTAFVALRGSGGGPGQISKTVQRGLVLLVVKGARGPLVAVVGSIGNGSPGAVEIPTDLPITIPGQGDGTVGEAVSQPGTTGRVAVANLLGLWIDHRAATTLDRFVAVVRRAGGITLAGRTEEAGEVRHALNGPDPAARELAWRTLLEGLLQEGAPWRASDLVDSDDPTSAAAILGRPMDLRVHPLPITESAGGTLEPDLEATASLVHQAFEAPMRRVVPVIVLNGSGAPGIGQEVARMIIPGGFRVAVSGNASSFGHATTVIVVAFHRERPLAERVRDLLGVGEVVVSGPPSGLGDVTIVVGKDLGTG